MTHREEKATVLQALGFHSTRLAQLNAKLGRKELSHLPREESKDKDGPYTHHAAFRT